MNRERIAVIRMHPHIASADEIAFLAELALDEERYRHALYAIGTKSGNLMNERGGAMADIHALTKKALESRYTQAERATS